MTTRKYEQTRLSFDKFSAILGPSQSTSLQSLKFSPSASSSTDSPLSKSPSPCVFVDISSEFPKEELRSSRHRIYSENPKREMRLRAMKKLGLASPNSQ